MRAQLQNRLFIESPFRGSYWQPQVISTRCSLLRDAPHSIISYSPRQTGPPASSSKIYSCAQISSRRSLPTASESSSGIYEITSRLITLSGHPLRPFHPKDT